MNGIRVGVIGLGSIGLRMLVAFEEHPDFVATFAWDPSSSAIEAARAAEGRRQQRQRQGWRCAAP